MKKLPILVSLLLGCSLSPRAGDSGLDDGPSSGSTEASGGDSSGGDGSEGRRTTGATTTPGADTDTDADADADSDSDSGESSDSEDSEGCAFLCDDTSEPLDSCDPWAQDCPEGQKCTYYADDGGGTWNNTKCVDIAPEAALAGEPCTIEGPGLTGVDSCDLGSMCWDMDPETDLGVCVALCTGTPEAPTCDDPKQVCSFGKSISICFDTCDPVGEDCPVGCGCYFTNQTFQCFPDQSGDAGAFGDACEYTNACDPGLFCGSAESFKECAGSGCCSEHCDLGDIDPCPDDLECVPWFEEGEAPPDYEHIGGCV